MYIFLDELQKKINSSFFYDKGITGKGVKIAVLDSGVTSNHPMLKDKVFYKKQIADGNLEGINDIHGSWVSSAAAGNSVTEQGHTFSGIAPGASIANIKVLNDDGNGTLSQVMEGIYAAIDSGCDIINMSLGTPYDDGGQSPMSLAVDYASSKGVIVVCATGNERTPYTPSTATTAIAVGANTIKDFVSSYSGQGPAKNKYPYPTITSFGGEIDTEYLVAAGHGGYYGMVGTSMAAPLVSGIIALFIEHSRNIGRKINWEDVLTIMSKNAIDIQETGVDWASGYGRTRIKSSEIEPLIKAKTGTILPISVLLLATAYTLYKKS